MRQSLSRFPSERQALGSRYCLRIDTCWLDMRGSLYFTRGFVICIHLTRIPVTEVQMSFLKDDDALSSLPLNGSELFPKRAESTVFKSSPFPRKCTRKCRFVVD